MGSQDRPRPVLATLNRASDVYTILSNRITSVDVHIAPDLPPEVRCIQFLLRKERKFLMHKGRADWGTISFRGNGLFIGERLHGRVINGDFVRCDSLDDHAPVHSLLARYNATSVNSLKLESSPIRCSTYGASSHSQGSI